MEESGGGICGFEDRGATRPLEIREAGRPLEVPEVGFLSVFHPGHDGLMHQFSFVFEFFITIVYLALIPFHYQPSK